MFMAIGGAQIGIDQGGETGYEVDAGTGNCYISNNMFQDGNTNIAAALKAADSNPLLNAWPSLSNAGGDTKEDYEVNTGSPLINAGKSFSQPSFPMAGVGIFQNITSLPTTDILGEPIDIENNNPNIGASNKYNSNMSLGIKETANVEKVFKLQANPATDLIKVDVLESRRELKLGIYSISGKKVFEKSFKNTSGQLQFELPENITNGIYFIIGEDGNTMEKVQFILYR